MISIVIPALNAERTLVPTLAALVSGATEGIVSDVVLSDGGSSDETRMIADEAGCTIVTGPRGRGGQIRRGIEAAKGDWILVLHADTQLGDGWERDVATFIERERMRENGPRAAAFAFRLRETGWKAVLLERIVALRCLILALPYGDQGLLIPRSLYRQVGGYSDIPLMEDVDIVRKIGRSRLVMLRTPAETSAERYRRDGYFMRMLRNVTCLTLYFMRVSPQTISRLYG
ncbi:MAG: TIGR04283 family arsenosugar biosynthesis glycosyltransferase [Rhodobiaceae bacterium]|nr:TIGR04283 family arsenosugar biosynthesis glycosyltransferase [Rhodobiaceae bacterium]